MGKGIWIIFIILVIVGFWYFGIRGDDSGVSQDVTALSGEGQDETVVEIGDDNSGVGGEEFQTHVVTITNEGYSPRFLEISLGDNVRWLNTVSRPNWPATDIHPSHTVYPGSARTKCGSDEEESIFDACRGLAEGETYAFTFNTPGSWGYHDHLRASIKGVIIVS